LEMPCVDLQAQPAPEREALLRERINEHARRPFDLAVGPLIRGALFRLDENDHALLFVFHHSVSDGWSLALFFQELSAFYETAASGASAEQVPTLQIQYADFASWQRQRMTGALLADELTHWKKTLAGAPAEIALPLDYARPERPSGRANVKVAHLPQEVMQRLTHLGHQQGCTPFMALLSALMITLRKWTGQRDQVIGTVVAGRTRRELESLIGCFMNFLPLRAQVQDAQSAQELLGAVRSAVLDAQSHQDCPFEKIVEAVNPQRRRDQNPLYNVAFLLQNFPPNLFETHSLKAASLPVSTDAALLDLRFEIEERDKEFAVICEYKTDLFKEETIEQLLESWQSAIHALGTSPEKPVNDFQLTPGLLSQANRNNNSAKSDQDNILITATFTAEPVQDSLQFWVRRLELPAGLNFAPYNQVFQQLLDPSSLLVRNSRGLNILLARLEDWQGAALGRSAQETASQALERAAAEFVQAVKACAARSSVPLLISLCPPSGRALKDPMLSDCLNRLHKSLETELAAVSGVYLLTNEELRRWYPVVDYDDPAGEELGAVPYTPAFFTALGTALARKYHALKRSPYKVIALDCDNTLWCGVCGEEGPGGVQLDDGRRTLQEFMRQQKDSGMILCLCSKNNEEDVHAVFSQRAEFPLQMKDLAACRLNWSPKSANLKSLAQELNLGLDSFIFLDDNPVECAEVQANCPEVLTLQLPEDPTKIAQFLAHCWVFDHLRVTKEDRDRAELYRQNRLREQLRAEAPTLEDFLAGLELKVNTDPIAPAHWARVSQLTQRTNQFNTTTLRLSEKELKAYLDSAEGLIVQVSDRFGDYGLVGAVLYKVTGETLAADNLLLSCRVLGRGIEHRVVSRLGDLARKRKSKWVDLKFVPSAKNKPALDFLEQNCGDFKQPLDGGSVFRLPVGFAAELAFHPGAEVCQSDPRGQSESKGSAVVGRTRFDFCRTIALELNDAAQIQAQISSTVSVRARRGAAYTGPKTELEKQLC
ncbi:MAG TPA: HAD-IIIC family phosphatase, partial [Patescibacteria group bacterium]|nr:HAD-IIIC family phosphatase [Patescibacteria group bacterium]